MGRHRSIGPRYRRAQGHRPSLLHHLGSRGSVSVVNGHHREVSGFAVEAIDTTGAGDIYAGACLHGLRLGMAEPQAARFGNYAAAALVRQYGARLRRPADYRQLIEDFKGQ